MMKSARGSFRRPINNGRRCAGPRRRGRSALNSKRHEPYVRFRPMADPGDLAHVCDMRVMIFEAEAPIGEAEVYALDPPMCVAMAKFYPAVAYDPASHANVIDGDYVADRSEILRLEMEDGTPMESEAISIVDFPTLDEREVHIIGIYEPSFDKLFSKHADFKAYFGKA